MGVKFVIMHGRMCLCADCACVSAFLVDCTCVVACKLKSYGDSGFCVFLLVFVCVGMGKRSGRKVPKSSVLAKYVRPDGTWSPSVRRWIDAPAAVDVETGEACPEGTFCAGGMSSLSASAASVSGP